MPSSRPSSPFGLDVFKLVTGTTIAQIITILSSPILTRLYGPEAFGFFALITSITSILGVIVCLRYELSIMLPKEDSEAANLLGLCLLCVVAVSGLTALALYISGDAFVALLKAPGLAPYLVLIPAIVFVHGCYLALNYWNSRTKHFGRLSIARITSSLASTGTQLGAGFAGYATGGSLIVASLVGSTVSTGVLGGQILRDDHLLLRQSISWRGILDGLKRYKKFPLFDSWASLLNSISWQLPAFLLAAYFSPTVVGFYALGLRIIQLPMSLIGSAISQVFFQRASVAIHQGTLASVTESIFEVLLKLGLFPMLLIAVAGENLFLVIFGSVWSEAGVYAQILSIWAIVWFLSSPLSTIFAVREKITLGLGLSTLNFGTRLAALVIGGVMGSELLAIALFSLSGIITYGTTCGISLRLAGVPVGNILRTVLGQVRRAGIFLIPVVVIQFLFPSPLYVVVTAALCAIGYYLDVYFRDPQFKKLTGTIMKKT